MKRLTLIGAARPLGAPLFCMASFFEEPLLGATCAPCSPQVASFSGMVASEKARAWMMAMRRFQRALVGSYFAADDRMLVCEADFATAIGCRSQLRGLRVIRQLTLTPQAHPHHDFAKVGTVRGGVEEVRGTTKVKLFGPGDELQIEERFKVVTIDECGCRSVDRRPGHSHQ